MSPSSKTALIVDDEESARDLLCRQLKRLRYDSVAVPNGEKALEQMLLQRFDLVILDMKMPGMSGLDVLRRLRRAYPDTSVVMLSAVVDVELTASALSLGADEYVTKPCSTDYLKERIEAAQAHRKRVSSGESPRKVSLDEITKDLVQQQVALFERLNSPSTDEEH